MIDVIVQVRKEHHPSNIPLVRLTQAIAQLAELLEPREAQLLAETCGSGGLYWTPFEPEDLFWLLPRQLDAPIAGLYSGRDSPSLSKRSRSSALSSMGSAA